MTDADSGGTWGDGFAMVPGWLLRQQPSANAVLVYIHLAMHGTYNPGTGRYEQCRPSAKTLANGDTRRGYPGTGLSINTVRRAIAELEALGALVSVAAYDKRGAQLPNVYRLVGITGPRRQPLAEDQCQPDAGRDESSDDERPRSSDKPAGRTKSGKPHIGHEQAKQPASVDHSPAAADTPADAEATEAAEALTASLPPISGQPIPQALKAQLIPQTARLLAAGWTSDALHTELTAGVKTAISPGVYRHRLQQIPATPPPPPTRHDIRRPATPARCQRHPGQKADTCQVCATERDLRAA